MPAILPPGAFDLWLDCAAVDAETASAFIVPAPEALLEAYPVSTAVNRAANDGPELIAPVSAQEAPAPPAAAPKRTRQPKPDKRQPSLF
jgi:putative SOS response-associated peptidase YedK